MLFLIVCAILFLTTFIVVTISLISWRKSTAKLIEYLWPVIVKNNLQNIPIHYDHYAKAVGKKNVFICSSPKYKDLALVLLHEYAHIMSKTYGHEQEFKDNLEILLKDCSMFNIEIGQNFMQSIQCKLL